jgi:thiol-disulfide isomerase/thioredoxin
MYDIAHREHEIRHYSSGVEDSVSTPNPVDTPSETLDVPQEVETGVEAQPEAPETVKSNRSLRTLGIVAVVVIVALLGASQVVLIASQRSAQSQIESLNQQITNLDSSIGDVSKQVDEIAVSAASAAANNAAGSATPAPAVPAGFLPRFSNQGPDQAIGMTLTTVEGPDGYGDSTLVIDPADGTKRVWMIWAHWCPYCQEELPELDVWWPQAKDQFPNAELVTVTTSMDPSRGNALEPYLESSQFVFPVVVDTDTKIAAQMGVNAFPFWMVTNGDGTVLFRSAGALHMDQVEQLFLQLEEFDA